jgi:hypothetical protein
VARTDDLVLDSVQCEELGRLCVLPRRHLNVVPSLEQEGNQGPEERDLGGVRDVDPDTHGRTLASGLLSADQMVYFE